MAVISLPADRLSFLPALWTQTFSRVRRDFDLVWRKDILCACEGFFFFFFTLFLETGNPLSWICPTLPFWLLSSVVAYFPHLLSALHYERVTQHFYSFCVVWYRNTESSFFPPALRVSATWLKSHYTLPSPILRTYVPGDITCHTQGCGN